MRNRLKIVYWAMADLGMLVILAYGLSFALRGILGAQTPPPSQTYQNCTVVVNATTVVITCPANPPTLVCGQATVSPAQVGVPYTADVSKSCTGGVPPYSFGTVKGLDGSGLSLSPAGIISGTPTSPGVLTVSWTVADSSKTTAMLDPFVFKATADVHVRGR